MGKPGLARIDSSKVISRLCMCIVLVGVIIFGSAEHTIAASTTGSPPEIRAFNADPLILADGGHAVYMFEVYDATKIQVVEAGDIINEYSGPPATTSKGQATGRTTHQIRSGTGNTFEAVLIARNAGGEQKKTLTLSFETKRQAKSGSLIPPVSDVATAKKKESKLGPQTILPAGSISLSTLAPWPHQFAKCPSGCYACLKPEEAAAKGLTQKCLEQPCYYSPDKQQYWYCYGEPEGWCCKDGKVTPATQLQCKESGGTWYATEAEAARACGSSGWCCRNGQITPSTEAQCVQSLTAAGGSWYTTEAEAIKACEQCWCCTNGRYGQTTPDACIKMGGTCYSTQAQASERCLPLGWYCSGGSVYQGTSSQAAQAGATLYATQEEATKACGQCWCCTNGRYGQTTSDACVKTGGTCYSTQAQASERCQPWGWYCSGSKVYQGTSAQAAQAGATWYATEAEATRACAVPLTCWCCTNGRYGQATTVDCANMGGTCYATQAQASERCQPLGGCCVNYNVSQTTSTQCAQMGGKWYSSVTEAQRVCVPPVTYYCCSNGQVYQSKTPGAGCYTSATEAQRACVPPVTYYCCSNGQVYQSRTPGAGCYTSAAEAQRACVPPATYWCCSNGQVYQSKTLGRGCYASQAEAQKACTVYTPPIAPPTRYPLK